MIKAFIGVAAWLMVGRLAIACEDIAVVSHDARYLVLSGDTLEVKDVGNLWWLGIRSVDYVAPRSTLLRAAVYTDRYVHVATGELVSDESRLIVLRNVGRSLDSPAKLNSLAAQTLTRTWWLNESPDSRLLGLRGGAKPSLVSFNSDLSQQSEWPTRVQGLGIGVSCADGGRVVVGGHQQRMTVTNDKPPVVDRISTPSTAEKYQLLAVPPVGCTALLAENVADANDVDLNSDQLAVRTINLATNVLGPRFQMKRAAESVLIASGAAVFQQELAATLMDGGGYRMTPTGQMRVVDTRNGSILKSAGLPAGETGRLACSGGNERILISAPGKIYLVDLEDLAIIASRQVPFDRYFAF